MRTSILFCFAALLPGFAVAADTVVCVSEGTVNVRSDSFDEVLFSASLGDKLVLSTKEKVIRTVNGASVTYVNAHFVEQERDGWISELYVRPIGQCPGAEAVLHPPVSSALTGEVHVIYFGGYLATSSQVACWKDGARKKAPSNFTFEAVPWPAGAGSGYESAVNGGAGFIRKAADETNANKNIQYIVVGHSSGAALSNTVVERVKDLSHVSLVNLDGFAPSQSLQKKLKEAHAGKSASVCVTSRNKQNGTQARNFRSMTGNCTHSWVYEDRHCTTSWCHHFAIVSKSTPAGLGIDFPRNGYQGCDTNLDWLKELQ